MKLISCYTPSHQAFVDDWFIPSLPEGLEVDPRFYDLKSGAGAFLNEDWTSGVKSKSDTIIQAIKDNWGDIIVYADVDIQFFGPTEAFFREMINDMDIVLQQDDPEGNFCTGLFVARCNGKILKLWEDVRQAIEQEKRDQLAFNRFIRSREEIRYGYFHADKVFGGGTFLGQIWKPGMRLHIPRNPLIHHANWVVGVEDKIAQMKYVKKTLMIDRPALKVSREAPKISVITPVLNGERFIEECLLSVIDQNCTQAEHLIIDGGSMDRTMEIVKSYADEYPHIQWVSEKDRGQSHAMNKGLAMAHGKTVGFLNADDFYEAGVLKRAIALIEKMPEPAFIVGNCKTWGNNGLLCGTNKPRRLALDDLLMGYDINQFPVNPSAYFYSRSLHEKIGFFNEEEHYSLDIDFVLRAAKFGRLKYFNENWGNFRFMEGTKTYTESKNERNDLRVESLMESFLQQLPVERQLRIKVCKIAGLFRSKMRYYRDRLAHYNRKPREIGGLLERKLVGKETKPLMEEQEVNK